MASKRSGPTKGKAARGTKARPRSSMTARERGFIDGVARSLSLTDGPGLTEFFRAMQGGSGKNVTVGDPYREIPAIYRAVNVVGNAFTRGVQEIWKEQAGGKAEEKIDPPGQGMIARAFELLKKPNGLMSGRVFRRIVVAQAMLHSASYILVRPGLKSDLPVQLIPTIPGTIRPHWEYWEDPWTPPRWLYSYRGVQMTLRPQDIIQVRFGYDAHSPLGGVPPVLPAGDSLDTAKAMTVYRKSALANSGIRGFLTLKNGDELSDEGKAELKRRVYDDLAGPENADKLAFITGEVSFLPVEPSSARQMQLTDGEKKTVQDILTATGINPIWLGIIDHSALARAVVIEEKQLLYEGVIFGFAEDYDEQLTTVLQRFDERIKALTNFDNVDALREDMDARIGRVAKLMETGVTYNQAHKICDTGVEHETAAWANTPMIKQGYVPAELAAEGLGLFAGPMSGVAPAAGDGEEQEEPERDEAPRPVVPIEHAKAIGEVVKLVATGEIPRDAGLGQLVALYGLTEAQAETVMGSAGIEEEEKPDLPAPAPQLPPPPPAPESEGDEAERSASRALAPVVRASREQIRSARWRAFAKKLEPFEEKINSKLRRELGRQRSKVVAAIKADAGGERGAPSARERAEAHAPEFIARARELERIYGFDDPASRGHEVGDDLRFRILDSDHDAFSRAGAFTRDAKDVAQVLDPKALAESVRSTIEVAFTAGALGADRELIDIGVVDDSVMESEKKRLSEVAGKYWDDRRGLLVDVGDSIRIELRDTLLEGYAAGENLNDLTKRVKDVFKVSLKRCRLIARTESGLAVNGGRFDAMKSQGGEDAMHEWLSSRDEFVRDEHKALDGDRAKVGEPFKNGSLYPDDYNERCTTSPVSEEFEEFEAQTQNAASVDVESEYVMVRVSAENLARRALALGIATPCAEIARLVPVILAKRALEENSDAEPAEKLRSLMQGGELQNPAISGAIARLGGRVFVAHWARAYGQAMAEAA